MNYTDLQLKVNDEFNTFTFNDKEIKVYKYRGIETKYGLVDLVLKNSKDADIYNEVKIDFYFHLYLVYLYTDIDFPEEDVNEPQLYDELKSSGFMSAFLTTMDENEYNELFDLLQEVKEQKNIYNTSIHAVIGNIMDRIGVNEEEIKNSLQNIDLSNFSQIFDAVKALNAPAPEGIEE